MSFMDDLSAFLGSGATAGGGNNPATSGSSQLAQLLSGIFNLSTANSGINYGREAAGMADPFSSQRGQYQPLLNNFVTNTQNSVGTMGNQAGIANALQMQGNLLSNPQSLTSMPGYQFGLNQALEAVNRGAGASGLANSGNRLTALQDRGNQYAQGWENQIYNQLAQNTSSNIGAGQEGLAAQGQGFNQLAALSGVNAGSPGTAGLLFNQGANSQGQAIGAGVGGLAGGIGGLLANPNFVSMIRNLTSGGGGGIDLSSISGGDQNIINEIFGSGASGNLPSVDTGNPFFNPGDVSDSTTNLLGSIFGPGP